MDGPSTLPATGTGDIDSRRFIGWMWMSADSLFLCPQCRQPLPVRPPCSCGFLLRGSSGMINVMTDRESAVVQPLLDVYEQVGRDERWGGDGLDLLFPLRRDRDIGRIGYHPFRV